MRYRALAILLATFQSVVAQQVSDPALDYQARFQRPADLRLDIDLNGDGYPETFLSNEKLQNGREGRIWTVYQGNPEGWQLLEKPAIFREQPLQIVPATQEKPASLLAYWPAGAGTGTVQRIGLGPNGITQETVEEISESAVAQYFDPSSSSAVSARPPVTFAATATPSQAEEEAAPKATPEPRVKERTVTRTWIIAGIAVLLIGAVLAATMRRK